MIGIVIVAHGGLAGEFLAAIEHVVGPQTNMRAVAIAPDADRQATQAKICAEADAVDDGGGVVVVTDMYGGSPSNLSLRACSPQDRKILTGMNLPMLLKLSKVRHLPVDDAVSLAIAAGQRYINAFDGGP